MRSPSAPWPPRTRYSDVPPCWPWGTRACSWRSPSRRIQAFALATRTDDAIAAADVALPAAAGPTGRRWPSPLPGPAWPVSTSTGPSHYLALAGDPDDPRVAGARRPHRAGRR